MKHLCIALLTVMLGFAGLAKCHAGYVFSWIATSANPSAGTPITVDLYLNETATDTNLQLYGASAASYQINLTGVGSLAAPVGNAGFDAVDILLVGPNSYSVSQVSILGLTPVPPSTNLLIGSFQINYSGDGNGMLMLTPFGSGADIAVYDSGFNPQVLDGTLFPGAPTFDFSFNTTAVPEPSSLLLCLFGVGAIAMQFRVKPRPFNVAT